jgi:hypothetical protein
MAQQEQSNNLQTNEVIQINYEKMTRNELTDICKNKNISGFSKKKKQELIEMIEQKENTMGNIESSVLDIRQDNYNAECLREQYALHKSYVKGRIETTKNIGIKVRLPSIPEDISENIVKFINHNKLNDKTSRWDCKQGDLLSQIEGKQECKCFTSDGPPSFTPKTNWDVIYFLDARNWLNDIFILYRISLQRTSVEWKNIKVSKTQTFEQQCDQGRRPRITWESLYPQIHDHCVKVYEGHFDDIFIPIEVNP